MTTHPAAPPLPRSGPPGSGDLLATARVLLASGRPREARDALTRHLTTAPDDTEALCLLATALVAVDDPVGAARAAGDAHRLDPQSAWAMRLLSWAVGQLGRHGDAALLADRAVAAEPDQWHGHARRADVDVTRRRIRRSTWAATRRAVTLAPAEPETHLTLARVALAAHRPRRAAKAAREALRLDPQHTEARNTLAAADLRGQRVIRAATGFRAAAAQDPQSPRLRANLYRAVSTATYRAVVLVGLALWAVSGFRTRTAPGYGAAPVHRAYLLPALAIAAAVTVVLGWVALRLRRALGTSAAAILWAARHSAHRLVVFVVCAVGGLVCLWLTALLPPGPAATVDVLGRNLYVASLLVMLAVTHRTAPTTRPAAQPPSGHRPRSTTSVPPAPAMTGLAPGRRRHVR